MSLLRSLFSFKRAMSSSRINKARTVVRPFVELLEDRRTPTVSWTGGAGTLNWNDAANWSGKSVPGTTDDVIIQAAVSGPIQISHANTVHSLTDTSANLLLTGGSLSLAGASTIGQNLTMQNGRFVASGNVTISGALTESGGELTGSGTVTVNGLLTWTGGTMSGSGTTQAAGGLQLGASGQTDYETLTARTLANNGAAIWNDHNTLTQQSDATFQNLANGTLTLNTAAGWYGDGTGKIDNAGTMTVAAGSGKVQERVFLNNSGKVTVSSGTLELQGNGAASGNFSASSGATLVFGQNNYSNYAFNSGAVVSGSGTIDFGSGLSAEFASGASYNVTGTTIIDTYGNSDANIVFTAGSKVLSVGSLVINSGVVNFSSGSAIALTKLTQSDGTLTGSDAVNVSGLTTWTGGSMTGTGTTSALGGLQLGATDGAKHFEVIEARTVVNAAIANWVGLGEIDLFSGGTFVNKAGATFNDQAPATIWTDVGIGLHPTGLFNNQGNFIVAVGSGTAGMQAPFQNSGHVAITSGTWNLSGMGKATGSFTVNAGTTFNWNKNYLGGTVSGTGRVIRTDGSSTSPIAITGGAVTISSATPQLYRVDGNVTISSLKMTQGTLVVEGTLTIMGSMTWTGGYIVGPGTIKVLKGLQLGANDGNTGHYESLYGATLSNAGSAVMYDSFAQQYGSTFANLPGATLDLRSNGTWNSDGTATLVNQGTFKKTAGAGSSVLNYLTLMNTGSVLVNSGTLDLEGTGTATGSFSAAAGSTLEFGHGYWGFNSLSSVSGAGTVEFPFNYWSSAFNSGSTYIVSGATIVNGAAVTFFPGSTLKQTGTLSIQNNGVWDFAGSV
jgi:hypothetical protein